MQYHLDTIPVWDAIALESDCPLCALHQKCELSEVERSLGGSVMEPDARIRVNERGICAKHHQQLFVQGNRLGHALLVDSHSKELLKKLKAAEKLIPAQKGGLFGKATGGADELIHKLRSFSETCVICEDVDSHMQRYLHTFVHLYKTDKAFQSKWDASAGVCLPHAVELLTHAQKQLNAAQLQAFCASLLALLQKSLTTEEQELEWFTLKFDYRNTDKPWGNSKTALERTINRLRGRCIGTDAPSK
ncbi:MAG: DUF6062 family protein [Clostridia bacterium]